VLPQISWFILDERRRTSCELFIRETKKESRVKDLVFTLVTIGFFLVAIGYLRACERLK
jgi:hypothetical protein